MANIDRILNKKKQNEAFGQKMDFEKKVLQSGNNKFRIIGDIKFIWEHWFIAACGTPVHSVCSKDEDGEGECKVCERYDAAVKLLGDEDADATEKEVELAEVIVGDRTAEGQKYPSPWKAREFAYMNVIDRDDNWCKENDKTKILSKSSSQGGISSGRGGIFDEIIDVVDEHGDYEENAYDIRLKKSGKKMDTEYRGYQDQEKALSKAEEKYEVYDLDTFAQPTPPEVLKTWLEKGVKDDKKKDSKKRSSKDKEESKDDKKKKFSTKVKKKEKEVEEEEVEEKTEKKKPASKLKVKTKKKEPEPEEEVETAECPECQAEIPIDSSECPECGAEFETDDGEGSDV